MLDVTRLRVIDAVARHGSVTAAARELHYSQPSVSHHLARLEAETGRAAAATGRPRHPAHPGGPAAGRPGGRDHRPDRRRRRGTVRPRRPDRRAGAAGRLLVGDRLARAAGALAALAGKHPGSRSGCSTRIRPRRWSCCATGKIDVAIVFRYDETEPEPAGVRLHHLLDDPVVPALDGRRRKLAALRDATWIAGCERCRSHLLSLCAAEGFEPRIGYTSDDMVVMQALVAAGLGRDDDAGPGPARPPRRGHRRDRAARARSATCTPRPTANRPTRPPPPRCWRRWSRRPS